MAPSLITAKNNFQNTSNTNNSIFTSKFPCLSFLTFYLNRPKQNRTSNQRNYFTPQKDMLANMKYIPIKIFRFLSGCKTHPIGSYFPDQGLNLGLHSKF